MREKAPEPRTTVDRHKEDLYIDDVVIPGMLRGVAVRAETDGGRFVLEERNFLPPGTVVVTSTDIPGENRLDYCGKTMPILPISTIAYRDQILVLVASVDPIPARTLKTSGVIDLVPSEENGEAESAFTATSSLPRQFDSGDAERRMREAVRCESMDFNVRRRLPPLLDSQGAVSVPKEDGLLVYSSTQWPHDVRDSVARCLGLATDRVEVVAVQTGFHSGTKLWFSALMACYSALLAWKAKKPVSFVLRPEELRLHGASGAEVEIKLRVGTDDKDDIVALELDALFKVGAFDLYPESAIRRFVRGMTRFYPVHDFRVAFRLETDPSPPVLSMENEGGFEADLCRELLASRLFPASADDPSTWKRKRMALLSGTETRKKACDALLDEVFRVSDYRRKYASYRSQSVARLGGKDSDAVQRGIACTFVPFENGAGRAGACVELHRLSRDAVLLSTSAVPESAHTVAFWQSCVSSLLGTKPSDVEIARIATSTTRDSGPSADGSNTRIVSRLIEKACADYLRAEGTERASGILSSSDLSRESKSGGRKHASDGGYELRETSWLVCVLELEWLPAILDVAIRGVWIGASCGRIVNPGGLSQTLEVKAIQTLQQALFFTKPAIPAGLFFRKRIPVSVRFLQEDGKSSEPSLAVSDAVPGLVAASFLDAWLQASDETTIVYPASLRGVGKMEERT